MHISNLPRWESIRAEPRQLQMDTASTLHGVEQELLTPGVEERVRFKSPETYLVIQKASNCSVKKKKEEEEEINHGLENW